MNNKQIPQAEVTDEQILTEAARHLGEMHVENAYLSDILSFARAILALRPVQVPMTDDQITDGYFAHSAPSTADTSRAFNFGVRFAEAHLGITAQAKKEDA